MDSLMSTDKKCYVCGRDYTLHKHHIFFGANRKHSEKYGCWCWLCAEHHNMSNRGVHSDKVLDKRLKEECQKRFEKLYSHEKFMQIFGRNWL